MSGQLSPSSEKSFFYQMKGPENTYKLLVGITYDRNDKKISLSFCDWGFRLTCQNIFSDLPTEAAFLHISPMHLSNYS